jgi:hypothetical protein
VVDIKATREAFVTLGGETSQMARCRRQAPKLVVSSDKFVKVEILPPQTKRSYLVENKERLK